MPNIPNRLRPEDIAPIIRGANLLSATDIQFGPRHNYAPQLLYVFEGELEARLDGQCTSLNPGDLAFYAPENSHFFKSRRPSTLFTICFSWNRETAVCLETGNRNVPRPSHGFWAQADRPATVEGLPEPPFVSTIDAINRSMLEPLMREIGRDFKSASPLSLLRLRGLMLELVHGLIRNGQTRPDNRAATLHQRLCDFFEKHYAEPLDRAAVSRALGISESYLTALLRTQAKTNFTEALATVRMNKARELLQFSCLSVKQIAAATGFHSVSYFVARFRKRHGTSPGKYRY